MNRTIAFGLILMCLFSLTACGGQRAPIDARVDVQATVDAAIAAAIAATATASAATATAMQATIDAAVAATAQAASPSAVTPEPAATPIPAATPTAVVIYTEQYVTMTEEELAALIDDAVDEAVAASQQAAAATDTATDDGDVSSAEAQEVQVYVQLSEESIAQAQAIIDAYQGQYSETADEYLAVLTAMEQDLAQLAENTAAIDDSLQAINATLEQGLALAEESVAQLEAAAASVNAAADEIHQQAQVWQETVVAELPQRGQAQEQASAAVTDILANFQPTEIAGSQAEALRGAWDYANAVQTALGDGVISSNELNAIAQAGVNASAGLKVRGGPQMQSTADRIDQLTRQLAEGQLDQAGSSLQQLQAGLPALPSGPSAPAAPSVSPGGRLRTEN